MEYISDDLSTQFIEKSNIMAVKDEIQGKSFI